MNTGKILKPKYIPAVLLGLAVLAGASVFVVVALAGGLPEALWSWLSPQGELIPTPASATVGGTLWHDLCASDEVGLSGAPQGCVGEAPFRADGVLQLDETGIAGVTVSLGLGACPAVGKASTSTDSSGAYAFAGLEAGTYCVSVDSQSAVNTGILQPGSWTYPGLHPSLGAVTITLAAGQSLHGVNFGWDYRSLPLVPTPTVTTPVPTPTSVGSACFDRATFVSDISVPDNTVLRPGVAFDKIWRLRNSGTCTWTTGYALTYVSGHSMGGPALIPLAASVPPGSTIDLKVRLYAPMHAGLYRGNWQLRNVHGLGFGLGEAGNRPFWVQILVSAAGQALGGTWKGEYFANRELKGTPALIRRDPVIDFDWRRDPPASGIPADNFSVRWAGKIALDSATYRFRVTADDGVRLWVDDILVIDAWKDGGVRELIGTISVAKGEHSLRLEYYEHTQVAVVRLTWEKLSSVTITDWKGEYFARRDLGGTPALVRNDKSIDFDWGNGSPAVGIGSDHFSVRWSRQITLEPGTYRFNARSDDGIRLFVNGVRVLDEWHDSSGNKTYTVDRPLSGKTDLKVEYYERAGKAEVYVWWERLSSTPTPTATATQTATPTSTDVPPTQPPTPTPTETPVPTEEPTVEPGPAVMLDFAASYCSALWHSGSDSLPCPGAPGTGGAYVQRLEAAQLENGGVAGYPSLLTHPQSAGISGSFPIYSVASGDRFEATLACLGGQTDCSVTFELLYWTDLEPLASLGQWSETHDGQMRSLELDLSSLAGKAVIFVLKASADGSPEQAAALWIRPRIVN